MTQPLHPRPQLTRTSWTDLCGTWQFAYDDENRGAEERWFSRAEPFDREITVPFPPESAASGIGDPAYHPTVWYRRTFTVTPEDRAGRLLLHFGAVDYRAQVWVNGQLVARHEGGHTPFTADLTSVLAEGEEQIVTVRAEDDPRDLAQPRGKQGWKPGPHAIWYHRTTGIWQPVWLERVPETYIRSLRLTPDLDRSALEVQVSLNEPPREELTVRVRLLLRGERLASDLYELNGAEVSRSVALDQGRLVRDHREILWSPRHPNLVDVEVTLLRGEEVLDDVRSYTGLRSALIRDGHFLLNHSPFYPKLVLAQNYWPESHLAAPSADALRREVELVKELGFNGVRIHQKVEDPRFLYWCDVLGVLVWGEAANAYTFTPDAQERLTREWLEVLRRDHNHPCIVTWVPLNESWGVPNLERDPAQRDYVKAMYHLTKALDPSRPAIGNDGWQLVAGDILGIHDYTPEGRALLERYGTREAVERTLTAVQPGHYPLLPAARVRAGEPVMLTEFGGISFAPSQGERWWGYGTVQDEEAFLTKYAELVGAVLDCEGVAGFCYTQLTDTEQESNGLLHADRRPKMNPARLRAINSGYPRSMPAEFLIETHLAAESRDDEVPR
ncbi:glycoside hydrolase family 2 protein [Deinococcus apachensis]|uniref:glycoside hydrolase family 2 protein n=1 Tax=Deinococcus apachensis TaxID=309886 RepID=UPI00037DDE5B|nr:glycoside hydrolase family 2 [Deinococcus apachensis]